MKESHTKSNIYDPQEVFSCEFTFSVENIKTVLITQDSLETMGNSSGPSALTPYLHVHTCYEMFCCRSGLLRIHFENEVVDLNPGQLIIIAPRIYHAVKYFAEGTLSPAMLMQISNNGLNVDVDMYELFTSTLPKDYRVYDVDMEMSDLFYCISTNTEERNLFALSRQLHEFFDRFIRMNSSSLPQYVGCAKDNNNLRLHKIFTILLKSGTDISLEDVAESLHLSTRQLGRIIKDSYNCTFKELVVRFRMEKAADLLVQTKMTINDVAANAGYQSMRSFYSAFQNHYGCLPSQYRQDNSLV